jgi:hypothetical protein
LEPPGFKGVRALALACLLTLSTVAQSPPLAAAAGQVGEQPRVAIAFIPGPAPKVKPAMIERLAATRSLALGFLSSIQGSYSPEQALLDISSGSRTWTSLYDGELPTSMGLLPAVEGGTISSWDSARERATTPPADVVPGTLAQAVLDDGGSVAYVGIEGRLNREAIVAADRAGRVEHVRLATPGALGREAVRLWRRSRLLVASLSSGPDGRRALGLLFRARRRHDLLLAVQQPTAVRRRLLALGAAGLAGGENVRSDSTRTDGIVVSTDIAPTVLERLGAPAPAHVAGEPIEAHGGRNAEELTELKDRLSEIGPRRWTVMLAGLGGAALLASVMTRAWGGWRRRLARLAFLAALWLPSVLLVSGAIAPSRTGEITFIAVGTGLLALASDRLVPWPRGIALAAGVTVLAQLVDLALGSTWTARSLLGPNPILGARFYGIGNELEVALGVIGMLGLGSVFATARPRALMWGFVGGGGALAFALSWGKLGADVGASVMLAAGTAAAAVTAVGERPGRLRVAIVLAAPAAALAALAVVDLATGGNAHFTRSVLRAGGFKEVADVAQRRLELSYRSLGKGLITFLVAIAVVALVWGVRSRRRLLAPLAASPGLRAGALGALVAVVAGALANDSGPIILLIGTSYLALAMGYFWATAK